MRRRRRMILLSPATNVKRRCFRHTARHVARVMRSRAFTRSVRCSAAHHHRTVAAALRHTAVLHATMSPPPPESYGCRGAGSGSARAAREVQPRPRLWHVANARAARHTYRMERASMETEVDGVEQAFPEDTRHHRRYARRRSEENKRLLARSRWRCPQAGCGRFARRCIEESRRCRGADAVESAGPPCWKINLTGTIRRLGSGSAANWRLAATPGVMFGQVEGSTAPPSRPSRRAGSPAHGRPPAPGVAAPPGTNGGPLIHRHRMKAAE